MTLVIPAAPADDDPDAPCVVCDAPGPHRSANVSGEPLCDRCADGVA